ncbi:BLUF domain-containing protein [Brevundimonas variabilis]|uniref:BLUF domain-containing protein n=1 Tax=Brevundimonas variabilis TaxID=74312 RepID=A0A7W9CGE7_9CAUL|nr:BLUF domain-containing protein [Brevundimonas variabilis]MBB5745178.1 hypothetical protein [Brevundimonas variabilis]
MASELLRVVYRSRSTLHPDNVEELDKIFRAAHKNNRRDKLTGCLAHPDGHFVQVIEGEKSKVQSLMGRLALDERHADMATIGQWLTPSRLFTGWTMARPDLAPLHQQSLRIINDVGSGSQITAIMLALVEKSAGFYTLM